MDCGLPDLFERNWKEVFTKQVGVKLEKYFCKAAFMFQFTPPVWVHGKHKSPTLYFIHFLKCICEHLLEGDPDPVG